MPRNDRVADATGVGVAASMGPPHECRETVVGRASVPALAQQLQRGPRTNAAKRWWGGPPCPPWRSSFNGAAARMPRNGRPGTPDQAARCRFNGAAARMQRNVADDRISAIEVTPLQWGRRTNAAEWVSITVSQIPDTELQWGRRTNAAECRKLGHGQNARSRLQWGRRTNAAE